MGAYVRLGSRIGVQMLDLAINHASIIDASIIGSQSEVNDVAAIATPIDAGKQLTEVIARIR